MDVDQVVGRLRDDQIFPLMMVMLVFSFVLCLVLIGTVAKHMKNVRERQVMARMIREMLERNLEVDQIVRILKACGEAPDSNVLDSLHAVIAEFSKPSKAKESF